MDDGSNDKTFEELKKLNTNIFETLIIKHRANLSQSAAINTGIHQSKYENIIIMDGDLQNDPNDLSKMVTAFEKGTDMLIGWRKHRKDNFFTKTAPSTIANFIVRLFSKSKIHDHGCAFKILKKKIIDDFTNWGDFHRLLAARVANNGYQVNEVEVKHNSRIHGNSNYGFSRILKVLIDSQEILSTHISNSQKNLSDTTTWISGNRRWQTISDDASVCPGSFESHGSLVGDSRSRYVKLRQIWRQRLVGRRFKEIRK